MPHLIGGGGGAQKEGGVGEKGGGATGHFSVCCLPVCKSNSIKKLRNNNDADDQLCECVAKVDNIYKFVVSCQEAEEAADLANMKFH